MTLPDVYWPQNYNLTDFWVDLYWPLQAAGSTFSPALDFKIYKKIVASNQWVGAWR